MSGPKKIVLEGKFVTQEFEGGYTPSSASVGGVEVSHAIASVFGIEPSRRGWLDDISMEPGVRVTIERLDGIN